MKINIKYLNILIGIALISNILFYNSCKIVKNVDSSTINTNNKLSINYFISDPPVKVKLLRKKQVQKVSVPNISFYNQIKSKTNNVIGYEWHDDKGPRVRLKNGNEFNVEPYQCTSISSDGNILVKAGNLKVGLNAYYTINDFLFYDSLGKIIRHFNGIPPAYRFDISNNGYMATITNGTELHTSQIRLYSLKDSLLWVQSTGKANIAKEIKISEDGNYISVCYIHEFDNDNYPKGFIIYDKLGKVVFKSDKNIYVETFGFNNNYLGYTEGSDGFIYDIIKKDTVYINSPSSSNPSLDRYLISFFINSTKNLIITSCIDGGTNWHYYIRIINISTSQILAEIRIPGIFEKQQSELISINDKDFMFSDGEKEFEFSLKYKIP